MAIEREININVNSNFEETTEQAAALEQQLDSLEESSDDLTGSFKKNSKSVLDNGGAMGLLNDLTGGLANTVKDAVEASALFTKSQKAQQAATVATTTATSLSSGALKLLKLAIIGTGVGALVLAVIALIVNFDKVKEAIFKLIPGLKAVGDFIGGIINAVTDFIGVTSDATRELDRLNAEAQKMGQKNQEFLDLYGDKYDEYTRRKIKANIDYAANVKEVNESEEKDEQKKLDTIAAYREKANREIVKADEDRNVANKKRRDDEAKKINDAETSRLKTITDFEKKLKKEIQDIQAVTDEQKLANAEKRELDELKALDASENKKADLKLKIEEKYGLLHLALIKKQEEEQIKVREKEIEEEKKINDKKLVDHLAFMEQFKLETAKVADATTEEELDKFYRAQETDLINKRTAAIIALQVTETYEADKAAIEAKYREEKERLDKETTEKRKVLVDQEIQYAADSATAIMSGELQLISAIQGLNDVRTRNKLKAAEGDEKKQEQIRKKAFEQNKKMQTAAAIIGGIQSVIQATLAGYSTGGPAGLVLGPVMGALAAVTAAINVAKIRSTNYESAASASVDAATPNAPQVPQFNIVGQSGENQLATTIAGSQQQPVQAYVVGQAVTSQQSLDRQIVSNATFI